MGLLRARSAWAAACVAAAIGGGADAAATGRDWHVTLYGA